MSTLTLSRPIPSRFTSEWRVVRFIPSRAAAPAAVEPESENIKPKENKGPCEIVSPTSVTLRTHRIEPRELIGRNVTPER